MTPILYLSLYHGPFDRPTAETIVMKVPRCLAKLLLPQTEDRSWAYLHRVWVRASERRAGRGTALLHETLRATDALGLSLVLRCVPFDDRCGEERRLRAWYGRHGFRVLGAHRPDVMIRRTGFHRSTLAG